MMLRTNAVIGFKHVWILQTITIIPVTLTFGGFHCTWNVVSFPTKNVLGTLISVSRGECAKSVFDSRIWARLVWVCSLRFSSVRGKFVKFSPVAAALEHAKIKSISRGFYCYFGKYKVSKLKNGICLRMKTAFAVLLKGWLLWLNYTRFAVDAKLEFNARWTRSCWIQTNWMFNDVWVCISTFKVCSRLIETGARIDKIQNMSRHNPNTHNSFIDFMKQKNNLQKRSSHLVYKNCGTHQKSSAANVALNAQKGEKREN
jgi:hypothetical protein